MACCDRMVVSTLHCSHSNLGSSLSHGRRRVFFFKPIKGSPSAALARNNSASNKVIASSHGLKNRNHGWKNRAAAQDHSQLTTRSQYFLHWYLSGPSLMLFQTVQWDRACCVALMQYFTDTALWGLWCTFPSHSEAVIYFTNLVPRDFSSTTPKNPRKVRQEMAGQKS